VLEGRTDNGDDDTDQTQHTCSPVRVKNSPGAPNPDCMNARDKRRRRRRKKNKDSRYSTQ
jgi:hypothetical protein